MRMCLEIEFSEIGNSAAMSVTRASVSVRRARMARRVGSQSALKTPSSWLDLYSPIWVNIEEQARRRQPPLERWGSEVERDADRAVIRSQHVGMDLGFL